MGFGGDSTLSPVACSHQKADGCGGLNWKICVLALAGGVYLNQDKLQCI